MSGKFGWQLKGSYVIINIIMKDSDILRVGEKHEENTNAGCLDVGGDFA